MMLAALCRLCGGASSLVPVERRSLFSPSTVAGRCCCVRRRHRRCSRSRCCCCARVQGVSGTAACGCALLLPSCCSNGLRGSPRRRWRFVGGLNAPSLFLRFGPLEQQEHLRQHQRHHQHPRARLQPARLLRMPLLVSFLFTPLSPIERGLSENFSKTPE